MSKNDTPNRPPDWTPEDDNPEYHTPFGKLPRRVPEDMPTDEYVDFSSATFAIDLPCLIQESITRALEQQASHTWKLPGDWWNLFVTQAKIARTPEAQAAWDRAHLLFFTLLLHHISSVQQEVAAQIEREFTGATGQHIAAQIRNADPQVYD